MITFYIYIIFGGIVGCYAGRSLKSTFSPEQYKSDWYGYLVNQLGHASLGVFLLIGLLNIHSALFGEFLVKWQAFVVLLTAYSAFEISQNGKKRDMIEDTIFVIVYGAGSCLYSFDWVGGSKVCGYTTPFIFVFFVAGLHLLWGIIKRINYVKV